MTFELLKSYRDIDSLRDIYLEESYVLGIAVCESAVVFTVDAVLTQDHPEYNAPALGEQYCYRYGTLCFPNVQTILEQEFNEALFELQEAEDDLGNIDSFVWEATKFALKGDWGRLILVSEPPTLVLAPIARNDGAQP